MGYFLRSIVFYEYGTWTPANGAGFRGGGLAANLFLQNKKTHLIRFAMSLASCSLHLVAMGWLGMYR